MSVKYFTILCKPGYTWQMRQSDLTQWLANNPELSIDGEPAPKRRKRKTGTNTNAPKQKPTRGRIGRAGGSLTLTLEGARPLSINQVVGAHWSLCNRYKNECYEAVRLAMSGDERPFACVVDIDIIAYFDASPQDSDNIFGKYYIDALRHFGIIGDDDMAHVRKTLTWSQMDKERPRVEIVIRSVGG